MALTLAHIAQAYEQSGKTDSAIYYYTLSLGLNYETKNKRGTGTVYNNLAGNYLNLNMLDSAIANSERGYNILKEIDDKSGVISISLTRGKIYLKLAKSNKKFYPKALASFEEGLKAAIEIKSSKNILSFSDRISQY